MAVAKKVTRKKTAKRSSGSSSGAKTTTKRTTRRAAAGKKVSVKMSDATPSTRTSTPAAKGGRMMKQRAALHSCVTTLRKVTLACKPRSVFGTFCIFFFGVLIGLTAVISFMYVSKNEVLLRLLIDENVSVLDGGANTNRRRD